MPSRRYWSACPPCTLSISAAASTSQVHPQRAQPRVEPPSSLVHLILENPLPWVADRRREHSAVSCAVAAIMTGLSGSAQQWESPNLHGGSSSRRLNAREDACAGEQLSRLRGLTRLQQLQLRGCFRVTDSGLRSVGALASLTSLDLQECWQTTAAGLAGLSGASWHPLLVVLALTGALSPCFV